MLTRLRQWITRANAPGEIVTWNPDKTWTIDMAALDARVAAQSGAYRPASARRTSHQVTIDVGEDKVIKIR